MSITRATTAKAGNTAASTLTTTTFVASAGNAIVVIIRTANGSISSVTDTAGNAYTLRTSRTTQDPSMWAYTAENIAGHASNAVTVTLSGSVGYFWVYAVQYSGVAASPFDVAGNNVGSGTDCVSTAFSTAQAGDVVVLGASQNTFTTYTAGTDFTLLDGSLGQGAAFFGGAEEYITSGILSGYTAHITSAASAQYTVVFVALKAAVSQPSPWIWLAQ